MSNYIYIAKATYSWKEYLNLFKVLISGQWTERKYASLFSKKLSAYLGLPYVTLTNSGSSANLLAIAALTSKTLKDRALQAGDEFITTPLCFPTTISPALVYGLIPKFVDARIDTLNIDEDRIEEQITKKTKLILFAHSLGIPANMKKIMDIAKKHNLWVIEDCCDALGSEYNGQKVGTFGDLATFSFYPAHHISMIEGGAVATKNLQLALLVSKFKEWGRDCRCPPGVDNTCGKRFEWNVGSLPDGYDHKYIYSEIGYNLKPTEFQCAVGEAQIDKLPEFIRKRKENYKRLYDMFLPYEGYFGLFPPQENISWFGFPFLLTVGDRKKFVQYFEKNSIGTRPMFAGNITKHPMYRGEPQDFPVSDHVMKQGVWIGCHPKMREEDFGWIEQVLKNYIQYESL